MKIATYFIGLLMFTGVLSSCKKEDSASAEDVEKANQFKVFIQSKQFQVSEYYASPAIDYIEDDEEVKMETDLFGYVSGWIKDDFNVFNVTTGQVTISQNAVKIPENSAEILVKNFAIGADSKGAYFDFLNYQYNPLKYRLVEFTSNYFLVYVDWHSGAKVYTKFTVLP